MHPRVLAERRALALKRMLASAGQLAAATGIEPLALKTNHNHMPAVRLLHENEALADWLEALANKMAKL